MTIQLNQLIIITSKDGNNEYIVKELKPSHNPNCATIELQPINPLDEYLTIRNFINTIN